jgi:hypothetical protein
VGTISISFENVCHSEEQRDEESAFVVVQTDSEILWLAVPDKSRSFACGSG